MATNTMRPPLKCFIASAFERADVDVIYDKVVVRLLRGLQIQPRRVDREIHNDDIDDKIIELIDAADFCIADLTYARPSVYYEAGYAWGQAKPVIYIARKDHFKPKDEDKEGNERIHFDLQMKNIISWTKPDGDFADRLKRRIQHVIRPLVAQHQAEMKASAHAATFASLSVVERRNTLMATCVKEAKRAGIKAHYDKHSTAIAAEPEFFYNKRGALLQTIRFFPAERVTKAQLKLYASPLFGSLTGGIAHRRRLRHVIIPTLNRVSAHTVNSWLNYWTPVEDKTFTHRLPDGNHPDAAVLRVIDKIESPEALTERLRPILEGIVRGDTQPTEPVVVPPEIPLRRAGRGGVK